MQLKSISAFVSVLLCTACFATAQENTPDTEAAPKSISNKVQEIGTTLNDSKAVQEISAGVLEPIYKLTEYVAHPAFYWTAFAIMVAGVVSFAGQLVLTKLLLLIQVKLNFKEILSDLLGLVISLVGLVLTTQAATENSSFTSSPSAVVSAAVVGVVAGIVFYIWGQSQELRAARTVKTNNPVPAAPEKRRM
jgi:uncharacterized lipoprotein YajG